MNRFVINGFVSLILMAFLIGLFPASVAAMERVQLSVFLVNIVENGGRKTGQKPISVYLDIKDREASDYVCGIAPRIRDRLLAYLTKQTFYLDTQNKLDLEKIRLDLWPIAYKAIPNVKLQNMLVLEGAGKVSSSEARLFIRTGCRRVVNDVEANKVKKVNRGN